MTISQISTIQDISQSDVPDAQCSSKSPANGHKRMHSDNRLRTEAENPQQEVD